MSASDRTPANGNAEAAADFAAHLRDPSSPPNPYPLFRRLRDEEPVHWSDEFGAWFVTGFNEAKQVKRNHHVFAREPAAQKQMRPLARRGVDDDAVCDAVETYLDTFIHRDPPDHTRLRSLVNRAFTPRRVASWRPRIGEIVSQVLDAVEDENSFDFLSQVAYPVPESVIWELLGAPKGDPAVWRSNARSHASILTRRTGDADGPPPDGRTIRTASQQAFLEQVSFFENLVEEGPTGEASLLSALIEAEESGDKLTTQELVGTLVLIVSAGHHTTANAIANGMLALLKHLSQFRMLQGDPSRIPNAVQEILRHQTPSRGQPRQAIEHVKLGGRTIKSGEQVWVMHNVANRDPRTFNEPDQFDITRPDARRHQAFGSGIHYCVGGALATMEIEELFKQVCARMPDLRLAVAVEELRWLPNYMRALDALPVRRGPG